MAENLLIGKIIKGVRISADSESLKFITTKGDMIVGTDADCCSHTWIEHVEMPALGLPAKVVSVEDLAMPDLGNMDGCDVVAYYGCKIVTTRGEIVIDYRNDSNGYYGGNLVWPGDYHYGGVFGQNAPKDNRVWKRIKKSS